MIWSVLLCLAQIGTDPVVTAELETRNAWLGDPVTLTVDIHFDNSWAFELQEVPKQLEKATVLDQHWEPVRKDQDTGLNVLTLKANLAWYEMGEFKVPPIEFRGTLNGTDTRVFRTPELTIDIQAMLQEDDQTAAPPRGQVELPVSALWPWLVGIGLFACVLAFFVGYAIRKRRKQAITPEKPLDPPYDEALARLQALTTGSLLKEGKVKAFYVEINQIIRRYYARLNGIPAEEMTTFELADWFEFHGFESAFRQLNDQFHDLCDRVKYAKYDPEEGEHNEVVNWAHQLLDQLKPQEKEVTSVAVG